MTEARVGFENFVEGLLRTTGVLQTGTGHMRRRTLAPEPCMRRPPGKREQCPGFIDRLFRFENEKRIRVVADLAVLMLLVDVPSLQEFSAGTGIEGSFVVYYRIYGNTGER